MSKAAKLEAKISFGLGRLEADGLPAPPTGKRSLANEFCIPATPECQAEVFSIDPSVQLQRESRGRIGCGPDECLCIASTHRHDYRIVLLRLAALDCVARIADCVRVAAFPGPSF